MKNNCSPPTNKWPTVFLEGTGEDQTNCLSLTNWCAYSPMPSCKHPNHRIRFSPTLNVFISFLSFSPPLSVPALSALSVHITSTSPHLIRRPPGFGDSPNLISLLLFQLLSPPCGAGDSFSNLYTLRPSDARSRKFVITFHSISSSGVWPHSSIAWRLTIIQHFRHLHDWESMVLTQPAAAHLRSRRH